MRIGNPIRANILIATLLGLGIAIFLVACTAQDQSRPSDKSRAAAIKPPEAATSTATATTEIPTPTTTATLTDTPIPTPSPFPTLRHEVKLAVPGYLRKNAKAAIQQLDATESAARWLLAMPGEQADIYLVPGEHGVPAGHRAIALTAPFESELEGLDLTQAHGIVASGHQQLAIMDWAEMPSRRKALRVDGLLPSDLDYPLIQAWSLIAEPGFELDALQLGPYLSETIHHDPLVQIAAVGDLMLARAIGYAIEGGDLSFPFSAVTSELEQADLTVGNLESALGDIGQPAAKSYTFRAPPAAVHSLADAGFDLLTLANNHALDYGPEALLQALTLLADNGIATVGAGSNETSARKLVTFDHEGLKVGFLGYVDVPVEYTGFDTRTWSATQSSPGLAWADLNNIKDDVAAAKNEVDIIIVLLHSGHEYQSPPSPTQLAAAQTAADAGADLVIGHHAHVLQGVEFRAESVIAYGLGNFAFEIDGDPTTAILNVWLDESGVRQLEYVPAVIETGGRPRIASSLEAYAIRQTVYYLTTLLNDSP